MNRKPEWIPAINEMRDAMREEWEEGTVCPCCSQKVQLYRRRVNAGMAEILVALARETRSRRINSEHRPFLHVERDLIRGNEQLQGARDWTTLKYWGLIEPLGDGAGRKAAGEWRITTLGLWVVEHPDEPLLWEFIEIFNDKPRGQSDKKRSLKDVLQRPFKLEELGRAA